MPLNYDRSPTAQIARNEKFRPLHVGNKLLKIGDDGKTDDIPSGTPDGVHTIAGKRLIIAKALVKSGADPVDAARATGLLPDDSHEKLKPDVTTIKVATVIDQKKSI